MKVKFTDKHCFIQGTAERTVEETGKLYGGIYQLKVNHVSQCLLLKNGQNAISLRHRRLGHVPFGKLGNIPAVNCKPSSQARQTSVPFSVSKNSSTMLFDLVHVDIWGPCRVESVTGAIYFITGKSYLLKRKGEAVIQLIKFFVIVETRFDVNVNTLRSDNGQEFY